VRISSIVVRAAAAVVAVFSTSASFRTMNRSLPPSSRTDGTQDHETSLDTRGWDLGKDAGPIKAPRAKG